MKTFREEFDDGFQNPITPDRFGDILFIGNNNISVRSVPSFLIQLFQSVVVRRILPSRFSHVAVCVKPGLWMDARPGVGISILETFEIWRLMKSSGSFRVRIFRPRIDEDVLMRTINSTSFAFEAYKNPYNYLLFLRKEKNVFSKRFYQERYFCSEFAVKFIQEAGLFKDLEPKKTLPAKLFHLCQKENWEDISNNDWYQLLESDEIQNYIFTSGINDEEILENRKIFVESNKTSKVYSTLRTLHHLHIQNLFLRSNLDHNFKTRMGKLLIDEYNENIQLEYESNKKKHEKYMKEIERNSKPHSDRHDELMNEFKKLVDENKRLKTIGLRNSEMSQNKYGASKNPNINVDTKISEMVKGLGNLNEGDKKYILKSLINLAENGTLNMANLEESKEKLLQQINSASGKDRNPVN